MSGNDVCVCVQASPKVSVWLLLKTKREQGTYWWDDVNVYFVEQGTYWWDDVNVCFVEQGTYWWDDVNVYVLLIGFLA